MYQLQFPYSKLDALEVDLFENSVRLMGVTVVKGFGNWGLCMAFGAIPGPGDNSGSSMETILIFLSNRAGILSASQCTI